MNSKSMLGKIMKRLISHNFRTRLIYHILGAIYFIEPSRTMQIDIKSMTEGHWKRGQISTILAPNLIIGSATFP